MAGWTPLGHTGADAETIISAITREMDQVRFSRWQSFAGWKNSCQAVVDAHPQEPGLSESFARLCSRTTGMLRQLVGHCYTGDATLAAANADSLITVTSRWLSNAHRHLPNGRWPGLPDDKKTLSTTMVVACESKLRRQGVGTIAPGFWL